MRRHGGSNAAAARARPHGPRSPDDGREPAADAAAAGPTDGPPTT
ncbi:unnamed protein product [Burkholderia pseudomallei]|nr:hypothetical protein BURPSPAST_J0815 [Burkholderia pseudomallei Pasteur 52237]VUD59201.1 unnamed protein product [Burkholderia pseudomallei]VUD61375.1 unnamed protein product [Burkholderia pseudomallei]